MQNLRCLALGLLLCLSPLCDGALSPVSVAIVPPLQFPPSDFSVTGFRLSAIWGHHRDLYGIDLAAIGNITDQDFTGLGISGGFNLTHGTTTAILLQFAGGANINTGKTSIYGVQAAAGSNWNQAASKVIGVQISLANMGPFTNIYGVQAGIYNKAQDVVGIQVGLINVASSLRGIQIGLLNFHAKGLFVVSPIINVGF